MVRKMPVTVSMAIRNGEWTLLVTSDDKKSMEALKRSLQRNDWEGVEGTLILGREEVE